MKRLDKNTRILVTLVFTVVCMIGLAFASVPLYERFCALTGLGGTTQRVAEAPTQTVDRYVTVTFDGNVDSALPWEFAPEVKHMRVKLGEVGEMKFRARNRSGKALVGTATFNVQPSKSGQYFNKIHCFCFTKQVLNAGQEAELPVKFFVDASLAEDLENDDVSEITLSYTFFLAKDQSEAQAVNELHISSSDKSVKP